MLPADASGYAEDPTEGMYNVEATEATCTENAVEEVYYTIPENSEYVSSVILIISDEVSDSATGHLYTTWTVTQQPSATAEGTATATCDKCHTPKSIELPKLGESGYTGTDATCETEGEKTYTIPDSALIDNNVQADRNTVKEVTVTPPATGHDYPATATRQENKFVVNCKNNCGENYTLTITFADGGGTGDAPDMSSMTVSFDKEAMTFSFTTPESCPFTAPASKFFDGWSVGENTYGNSAKVTVPATAEASITLTAQWTTEHTHSFTREPHYDIATDKVVITCAFCGEEKPYEVTGISLDDGAPSSFVVTDTAVGTEVTLPEDFTVNARGSWETDEDSGVTTAIAIPASELTAEIATSAFKNATITVELKEGVTATVTGVTLLTQKLPSGNVTVNTYTDRAREIGTFTGEFEIRYTLSGIQRNTQNDQTEGSPNMWNSWLLTFVSNGKDAVLREDNFMVGNFGRGDGVLNTATETTATEGMQATLQAVDELSFVVTRTYDTDAGVYKLTIVISGGAKDITVTITEPDTLGNVMTVYLAGEDTAYNYSAVNAADEQIAMTGIEADNVSVAYGTELNNVSLPVYGVYGNRAVKDLIASDYTLTCDGYSATTPDTYTVTVKYSEFEDTVSLTVLEENWIAVNKTIENPTAWATWYDLPVNLAFGQVISIKGSQAGANPTLMDGESIINWHTVLWQTNNGKFSGRLDNFGWTFGSPESPSAVTVGSGNTVALKNASGEAQEFNWEKVHYLMQNSDFTFTYDWTTEGVLKLTIEVTATSGDYEGWVYTNEYYMNVNADSLTNGVIDIHLTGDNITSFTVDSYLVRDSQ